jgi:glycosyltransferase involved in cell wall biosynthesis
LVSRGRRPDGAAPIAYRRTNDRGVLVNQSLGRTDQVGAPLVTAIMPTFNKAIYLQQAIDSVIRQTFTDWELIIVDDGSTDHTASILRRYSDKRIVVHTLSSNCGRSRARNVALSHARGRYIAICDSDDLSAPTRFERQVEFLNSRPEVGVVSAFIQVISRTATAQIDFPVEHAAIARRFADGKMGVVHGASMIRAECFEQLGVYCDDLRSSEDFELFRRFCQCHRFATLPYVLLEYRNELGAVPLIVWAENTRAHRYALYRSNYRGDIAEALTLDQFSRGWKAKLRIYTLDLLRFAHFNLRARVFAHYVVR